MVLFMRTITLKNVEASLHEALKTAARNNHRSLNQEILIRMEESLKGRHVQYEHIHQSASAVREHLKVYVADTDLTSFKNEGRA